MGEGGVDVLEVTGRRAFVKYACGVQAMQHPSQEEESFGYSTRGTGDRIIACELQRPFSPNSHQALTPGLTTTLYGDSGSSTK